MKRRAAVFLSALATFTLLASGSSFAAESRGIVISQVYGSGGNGGAVLNADYVELFNDSIGAVTMTNWTIGYDSAAGSPVTPAKPVVLNATLQPGQYFLVGMTPGTIGAALPTPDATGTFALSGSSGTVFLTHSGDFGPVTVDEVGYGDPKYFAGAGPAGSGSGSSAPLRKGDGVDDGCTDTNSNSADFEVVPITATSPRNSQTKAHPCGAQGNVKGLVISQVYTAGGAAGSTYDRDYVELFNSTNRIIDLTGLSLQTGNANANFDPSFIVLPGRSMYPGTYFLIAVTPTFAGGQPLPVPDFTGTAAFTASAGKVALVNGITALGCGGTGTPCPATDFVDLVGFGTVSQYEGTGSAPSPGETTADLRLNGGCIDTNDNSRDFTAATPIARTSDSAAFDCSATGGPDAGTDAGQGTDSGAPDGGAGSTDGGMGSVDSGTGAVDSGTGASEGGAGGTDGGSEDDGSADDDGGASGGPGGGGSSGDSGTGTGTDGGNAGDDDDDDHGDDAGPAGTGAGGAGASGTDSTSGGCSTTTSTRDDAAAFGALAFLILAFTGRRTKRNLS